MILPVGSSLTDVQLALKRRGSTEITPIPGTEGGRNVVYSPDGQSIAYVIGSELFKRPLVGGSPVRLAEDADNLIVGLAWLDDGTIVYEQDTGIARIPEDGGEAQVVSSGVRYLWVHGLPDARGVLVIGCVGNCTAQVADLYVVDLQDLSSELILEQVARAWYTPTGHLVYVRADGALYCSSSHWVLPARSAPPSSRRCTAQAVSAAGAWLARQVGWPLPVRWPATSNESLTAKLVPMSGPPKGPPGAPASRSRGPEQNADNGSSGSAVSRVIAGPLPGPISVRAVELGRLAREGHPPPLEAPER